jgi:hypothetical protein
MLDLIFLYGIGILVVGTCCGGSRTAILARLRVEETFVTEFWRRGLARGQ